MNIENPEDAPDIFNKDSEELDWADYQFKDEPSKPQMPPPLTLEDQKTIAKQHYEAGRFDEAYHEYGACLKLCEFRDDLATIYSNMTMCCIKQHRYEQAMIDINAALERSVKTDIKPEIMIKLRYRLALSLAQLRDYE